MALDAAPGHALHTPNSWPPALCDRSDGACSPPWMVVQTEPAREFEALFRVSTLPHVRAWLATEVRRRVALRNGRPVIENGHRKREEALVPLFRGYLFVCGQGWGPLLRWNREMRTTRLLTDTGLRPLLMPRGAVEALQARGRAGDGAIDLEAPAFGPVAVGACVRVGGPFGDIEGLVRWTDQQRVEVMMGMLRVTVDRAMVEVV
jgi:hypothetical protein